jgi:beta-phosphoglucomutase-like phosphatase (HAD superfamily)
MRAVIFDLDGTLVDTVYGHTLAWQRVFAEAGRPVQAGAYRVYGSPAELLASIYQLGLRRS